MKKIGLNAQKKERNRMKAECKKMKINTKRDGKTVKQQVAFFGKILASRKKQDDEAKKVEEAKAKEVAVPEVK
jgi:hypothetical protein